MISFHRQDVKTEDRRRDAGNGVLLLILMILHHRCRCNVMLTDVANLREVMGI